MPPPVADDNHKRRARRRLIGAVALTIVAVIILPLVLEDKPPPAGPLEVHMPANQPSLAPTQNVVEYAPSPANSIVEAAEPEEIAPAPAVASQASGNAATRMGKAAPSSAKPPDQHTQTDKPEPKSPEVAYTVQVGVFADKVNVQKLQSRISELGIKSYTDGLDDSTRVRVGNFKQRQDAEGMLDKLTAAGIKGQVVEK